MRISKHFSLLQPRYLIQTSLKSVVIKINTTERTLSLHKPVQSDTVDKNIKHSFCSCCCFSFSLNDRCLLGLRLRFSSCKMKRISSEMCNYMLPSTFSTHQNLESVFLSIFDSLSYPLSYGIGSRKVLVFTRTLDGNRCTSLDVGFITNVSLSYRTSSMLSYLQPLLLFPPLATVVIIKH